MIRRTRKNMAWEYISDYYAAFGKMPTHRQIGEYFGWRDEVVREMLTGLAADGRLRSEKILDGKRWVLRFTMPS